MRRVLAIVSIALALTMPSLAFAQAQAAAASTTERAPVFRFVGELLDAANKPISGVFRFTFELHSSARSSTPLWSETTFVAVEIGSYTIDLGAQTPLPQNLLGNKAFLAVKIEGFNEILRQEVTLTPYQAPAPRVHPAVAELTFAALADRALLADRARHAEDADRIGGKTLAEIDRYPELHRLFVELRQQVNVIRTTGGTRVANRTTATERVGGNAGVEYRVMCPEGQVVVGISGRADQGVDSLGLICAPLEHVR